MPKLRTQVPQDGQGSFVILQANLYREMEQTAAERLEIASEILASVDGPVEAGWDDAWAMEIDRREQTARGSGQVLSEWSDARARIAERLRRDFFSR